MKNVNVTEDNILCDRFVLRHECFFYQKAFLKTNGGYKRQ